MVDPERTGELIEGDDYGRIAESVAVQSGAVVSRTLLKSKGGNLTLFAFDQGEGLSEHTTPHDALVLILDGRVDVSLEGRSYSLEQGDFIRLPAGIPHALQATQMLKMALILFTQ